MTEIIQIMGPKNPPVLCHEGLYRDNISIGSEECQNCWRERYECKVVCQGLFEEGNVEIRTKSQNQE